MIKRICETCKKEFYVRKCIIGKSGHVGRYCSYKCYWRFLKGRPKTCIVSLETRKKISISRTGKHPTNETIEKMRKISASFIGKKAHHWKGGKHKTQGGYIWIRNTSHPFVTKTGYVPEHRLVMEKHLGRYLASSEIIHHINHNKSDNRIKNLMLCNNRAEHRWQHKKIKVL